MGTFTRMLNQVPGGPKGIQADFQHAARIFVDGVHRLAPRTKFLYYIYFEIDASAHQAAAFTATKGDKEMSLLIKRCDLPKMSFDMVTKNQYNRKKLVYKQIGYDPVTLTFHDDNNGIMHALYSLYYGYHTRDHVNKPFDYGLGNRFPVTASKFNMDIDIQVNLFKRISIFTLSKQRFNEYKLLGPRIKNWSHGDVDYSGNSETIENSMTIEYEAVTYNTGSVTYGVPDGFASLSYDTQPSPNTLGGGGLRGIAGALGGDIISNVEQAMGGSLSIKNILQKPGTFINAAIQSVNAYQKFNEGAQVGVGGILGALTSPAAIGGAVNIVGGVIGAKFPKDTGIGALITTVAVPKVTQAITAGAKTFGETFKGTGGSPPTSE